MAETRARPTPLVKKPLVAGTVAPAPRAAPKPVQLEDPLKVVRRASPTHESLKKRRGYSDEMLRGIAALGYVYYLNDELDRARTVFEGLVAIDPADAANHRALGAVCLRQGELGRAMEVLTHAIMMRPVQVRAYLLRGQARLAAGNRESAHLDLKHAVTTAKRLGPTLTPDEREAAELAQALLAL